jgi:4-deoxy-L-threo-5-hexosulose-uronate ketol-isomerase
MKQKKFDTEATRDAFLLADLFADNQINLTYTHYDRYIIGGVVPVDSTLALDSIDPLKAPNFLDRRELGIINIGDTGVVEVMDRFIC